MTKAEPLTGRKKYNVVLTQDQLDKQAREQGRIRVVPEHMRNNYDRTEGYYPGQYAEKDRHPHRGRIDDAQHHFSYEDSRIPARLPKFE